MHKIVVRQHVLVGRIAEWVCILHVCITPYKGTGLIMTTPVHAE